MNKDNITKSGFNLIGLYTVLMIVLKFSGLSNASWVLVFLPQILMLLVFIVLLLISSINPE